MYWQPTFTNSALLAQIKYWSVLVKWYFGKNIINFCWFLYQCKVVLQTSRINIFFVFFFFLQLLNWLAIWHIFSILFLDLIFFILFNYNEFRNWLTLHNFLSSARKLGRHQFFKNICLHFSMPFDPENILPSNT